MTPVSDAPSADDPEPTSQRVLRALADRQRRAILGCLHEREHPVALAELAADVAESSERDEAVCRTGLHHTHLPILDEAGLVEYEPAEKAVTLGDGASDAEQLNSLLRGSDAPP